MILRNYQIDCLAALWGELFSQGAALCALPCGSGKTEIMIALMVKAIERKPDIRIVVLVERVDLLNQTMNRITRVIDQAKVRTFGGGLMVWDLPTTITISTIQSVHRLRLNSVNLVIIDESHNVDQEEGRYIDFIKAERDKNLRLKVVAFTATPFRSDGVIYGKDKLFPRITYQRGLREMIDDGYLVPPRLKHTNEEFYVNGLRVRGGEYAQEDVKKLLDDIPKVKAQVIDAIPRLVGRKKIIWICGNIDHAEMVRSLLVLNGENAETIHSKQDAETRRVSKESFEQGDSRHMTNVSVLTEGYDYPPIDAIVLMRPIRSPVTYVQACGRGLRPSPGKTDCLMLDYGHVVENLGPLDNPVVPRKGKRKLPNTGVKFCPQCMEFLELSVDVCPICSYGFRKKPTDPTKNLSRSPNTSGNILSSTKKPPIVVEISDCRLEKYNSKSGNDCLRIVYSPVGFLASPYYEYFSWAIDYSRKRAYKRLLEMGVNWVDSLDVQSIQPIVRKPKKITVNINGKYPEIVRVEYV